MNSPHTKSYLNIAQLIVLMCGSCVTFGAAAIDCIPNDIVLTSQAEVNAFQANHGPGCDTTVGHLTVSGPDIVNLNGLSGLKHSQDTIFIGNNPALASLAGLSALETVQFSLWIDTIGSLTSLTGLSSLTSVGGEFQVKDCPSLVDTAGLVNLGFVHHFVISGNDSLNTLSWPPALTDVNEIAIFDNPLLSTISGVSGFSSSPSLILENNDSMLNLDAFSELEGQLLGVLSIKDNENLENLTGLSGVTRVQTLQVINNSLLIDLAGLHNLNGITQILNLTGNPNLTSISALSNLGEVELMVRIIDNPLLQSLDGLEQITQLGNPPSLGCLFGLPCKNLEISGNATLTDISAFSSLVYINRDLSVTNNPMLDDCSALDTVLDSVDDDEPGPGPGIDGIPDVGRSAFLSGNLPGCNDLIAAQSFE